VKEKPEEIYTLSLNCGLDFLKFLTSKGFQFSYYDGKVFLSLRNRKVLEEILKLYGRYRKNKIEQISINFVLKHLLERDIKKTEEEIGKTEEDFKNLYRIFSERGVKPNFTIFKTYILELQKKVFEGYRTYWYKKREQILKGFSLLVEEPKFDLSELLKKAAAYYGDNLKLRLFGLYLKLKLLEAKLAADTLVYGELENGS